MKQTTSGTGVGFCGLLFLVFLVLKLCKVIDWSWWWVTSPIWIMAGLAIIAGIITTICVIIDRRKYLKNERRK